jgi:hypothetical protein
MLLIGTYVCTANLPSAAPPRLAAPIGKASGPAVGLVFVVPAFAIVTGCS